MAHQTQRSAVSNGVALAWAPAMAFALVLAGCGGGGGGGGESTSTSTATNTPVATAEPAATDLVDIPSLSTAATDAASTHFLRLNEVRAQMGLGTLRWNGSLAASAFNHANYLQLNQASGHEEEPGLPGFTGITIADRTRATGYTRQMVQETKVGGISMTGDDGRRRMNDLLLAPVHRLQLIAPDFDEVGVGVPAGGGPLVTDLGSTGRGRLPAARRWMFPFERQTGIATAFAPGTETGLPADLPPMVGTPLTLSGFMFSMVSYSSVKLTEEGTGEVIDLIAMTKPGEIKGALIFFPSRVLKSNTAYVWEIAASVDWVKSTTRARFITGA